MNLFTAISIVIFTVQLLVLLLILYDTLFSIIGIAAKETDIIDNTEESIHKFACLIAAHNEEQTVWQVIESLKALDYPKHMYSIYVIADNCTDNTADIAKLHGAIPLIRNDPTRKSKGYGLEWAFNQLWDMEEQGIAYDAVCIFDADNIVSRNFLKVMDKKLHKYEVIQGYLDTKNPNDTWVTKSFAYSYWMSSRSLQLSRMNVGFTNQLGGTGMCIKTDVIKKLGWRTDSLTEDLEFTTRYVLGTGKVVGWSHEAKVYDEKPLDFKVSWNQRLRWCIGHIDCCLKYFWLLIKQMIILFDALMYLLQPFKVLFVSCAMIGSVIHLLFVLPDYMSWWIIGCSVVLYYILPVITLIKEDKKHAIKWIPLAWVFSLSWIPLIIKGFMKRKEKRWDHTKHSRTLDESEIKKLLT